MLLIHAEYAQHIAVNMLSAGNDVLQTVNPADIEAVIAKVEDDDAPVNAGENDGAIAQQNVDQDPNSPNTDDTALQSSSGELAGSDVEPQNEDVAPSFWANILWWILRLFESILESNQWKLFR